MRKILRLVIYSIISSLIILFVGLLSINILIKNKIENFIENRLPETITQSYEDLALNTLKGTITFKNVSVLLKSKRSDSIHTRVEVPQFIIENVCYWDYLFNNEIHIENIKLINPTITYFKYRFTAAKYSKAKPILKIYKPILINELSIDNAFFTMLDKTNSNMVIYAENLTVAIDDILITSETLSRRLPVDFGDYHAQADSIFIKMNAYENLSAKNLCIKDKNAIIEDISVQTKYSKLALSKIIPKERDHFNIKCPMISVDSIDFGFKNRQFYFSSSSIVLEKPSVYIFRDKLVADNTSIKPLYSEMLRKLPFDLTVSKAYVKEGTITYQERIKVDNTGGSVVFKNMNVEVQNLSNTYVAPIETRIIATSTFMKDTPFNLDWRFNVNDSSDRFLVKAEVGKLSAEDLNPFLEPNMRIQLEGNLNKTYMTTSGDKNRSQSDLKINFDNFEISILDKNAKLKNKLLSAIVNIFISKDSKKEADNFREASIEVTPDKTKSFFNYAWLNFKEGLIRSMTSRNKKKK